MRNVFEIEELIVDDTKVIILFSNTLHYNREDLLKGIEFIKKDVVVSGGVSGDNFAITGGRVFYNDNILSLASGTVGVSLSSKELNVFTAYSLGWTAIGKKMEDTSVSGGKVSTIDNVKSIDMYRKYLGNEIADN